MEFLEFVKKMVSGVLKLITIVHIQLRGLLNMDVLI